MSTIAELAARVVEVWDDEMATRDEVTEAWGDYERAVMAGVEVMPSTFHRHTPECWTTEPVLMSMPGSVGKAKVVQCAVLRALPQNPQWSLFVASDVGYVDAAD